MRYSSAGSFSNKSLNWVAELYLGRRAGALAFLRELLWDFRGSEQHLARSPLTSLQGGIRVNYEQYAERQNDGREGSSSMVSTNRTPHPDLENPDTAPRGYQLHGAIGVTRAKSRPRTMSPVLASNSSRIAPGSVAVGCAERANTLNS